MEQNLPACWEDNVYQGPGTTHRAKCSLNCLCVTCLHKMQAVFCCCAPCTLNSSQAPLGGRAQPWTSLRLWEKWARPSERSPGLRCLLAPLLPRKAHALGAEGEVLAYIFGLREKNKLKGIISLSTINVINTCGQSDRGPFNHPS